jgi:hypothetical protein
MSPADNSTTSIPFPSEYILDNFEATERIAMLVLNRPIGETIQHNTSAPKASSPEFQAWLRCKITEAETNAEGGVRFRNAPRTPHRHSDFGGSHSPAAAKRTRLDRANKGRRD